MNQYQLILLLSAIIMCVASGWPADSDEEKQLREEAESDMVVVQPPVTVTTYKVIIDSGWRPLWIGILTGQASSQPRK
jgi:hypothetical protein